MKKVTPEECYNAFHKITNEVKGQKVRAVQNFENAKAKPEWNQFVTFAERVNRSNGMIDLRMYILALATKYEGWFQPKFLNSQVSISIYKSYMKLKELDSTDDNVKAQILKTFKHILEFCQEHQLSDCDGYLQYNKDIVPQVAIDLSNGNVNKWGLCCIKNFDSIIDFNYPPDVKQEFFKEFLESYANTRTLLINIEEEFTKKLILNFEPLLRQKLA